MMEPFKRINGVGKQSNTVFINSSGLIALLQFKGLEM